MIRLILIFTLFLLGTGLNAQDDNMNEIPCADHFIECRSFCNKDNSPSAQSVCYQVCTQVYFACRGENTERGFISVFNEEKSAKNKAFIEAIEHKILADKNIKTLHTFNLGRKLELTVLSAGLKSVLGVVEARDKQQVLGLSIYNSENKLIESDEVSLPKGKSAIYMEYFELTKGDYTIELINLKNRNKKIITITVN